jgi:uncharacterized lipoprotein NlpE involved in copper resistance
MKKIIISCLITMAAFTIIGCNNGAYDANPKSNNSGTPNPLDPKNDTTSTTFHTSFLELNAA